MRDGISRPERMSKRKREEEKKQLAREKRRSKKKFSAQALYILNIHDTKVFGVMSYNYMFLALYSLKSFFSLSLSFSFFLFRLLLWFATFLPNNSISIFLPFFFISLELPQLLVKSLLLRFIQITFRDVAFMLRFSVLTR